MIVDKRIELRKILMSLVLLAGMTFVLAGCGPDDSDRGIQSENALEAVRETFDAYKSGDNTLGPGLSVLLTPLQSLFRGSS
jgi:hypothetical protein